MSEARRAVWRCARDRGTLSRQHDSEVALPADSSDRQGFFSRTVPVKWVAIAAAALVLVMAAVVVAVVLVERSDDAGEGAAATAATATTAVASPYDLVELPAEAGLEKVEDSAFISLYLPNADGTLTSYGISSHLDTAQALTAAVLGSDEVDADAAAAALGSRAADSTMTFVLATRETITFALYLDQGMIARGAQVWRPQGDLKALVQAATAGPR